MVGRGPASHNWNQPPFVREMEMGAAWTHLPFPGLGPWEGRCEDVVREVMDPVLWLLIHRRSDSHCLCLSGCLENARVP